LVSFGYTMFRFNVHANFLTQIAHNKLESIQVNYTRNLPIEELVYIRNSQKKNGFSPKPDN